MIIELFGIPACGKTTLANFMSTQKSSNNIIKREEAWNSFKRLVLLKKLYCVSLKSIILDLCFLLILPKDCRYKKIGIMNFLSNSIFYSYCEKYQKNKVVLDDHGLIQSFVTWEWGMDLHNQGKFVHICKRIIRNRDSLNFVFCDVPIDIAISRIKERGRNVGRFDNATKAGNVDLHGLYEDEHNRFDFFYKLLIKEKCNVLSLDMCDEVSVISDKLMNNTIIIG